MPSRCRRAFFVRSTAVSKNCHSSVKDEDGRQYNLFAKKQARNTSESK